MGFHKIPTSQWKLIINLTYLCNNIGSMLSHPSAYEFNVLGHPWTSTQQAAFDGQPGRGFWTGDCINNHPPRPPHRLPKRIHDCEHHFIIMLRSAINKHNSIAHLKCVLPMKYKPKRALVLQGLKEAPKFLRMLRSASRKVHGKGLNHNGMPYIPR